MKINSKNPQSGKWEEAEWMENYFGPGIYGVKFPSGRIFDTRERRVIREGEENLEGVPPHNPNLPPGVSSVLPQHQTVPAPSSAPQVQGVDHTADINDLKTRVTKLEGALMDLLLKGQQ